MVEGGSGAQMKPKAKERMIVDAVAAEDSTVRTVVVMLVLL